MSRNNLENKLEVIGRGMEVGGVGEGRGGGGYENSPYSKSRRLAPSPPPPSSTTTQVDDDDNDMRKTTTTFGKKTALSFSLKDVSGLATKTLTHIRERERERDTHTHTRTRTLTHTHIHRDRQTGKQTNGQQADRWASRRTDT